MSQNCAARSDLAREVCRPVVYESDERLIYIWILSKWYLHIRLSRKLGQHFRNSSSSPHYPTSITELVTHSLATLPNSPAKSIPVPYGQSSSRSISRTFLSKFIKSITPIPLIDKFNISRALRPFLSLVQYMLYVHDEDKYLFTNNS